MQAVKNRNIPLILQLIKSDLTYEDSATVKYTIYNADTSTIEISETETTWNDTLNAYTSTLSPSSSWTDQSTGNYLLVWSISDTDYFASTMIEELVITSDSDTEFDQVNTDLSEILGLVHKNIYIDNAEYDKWDNLIGGRVRIYSNSSSVGTNNDVISTYQITSQSSNVGKFTYWKQVEV